MRLIRVTDASELARVGAEKIARQLAEKPTSVIALPTGRTPVGMYRELVAMRRRSQVDFPRARVLDVDEFYPVTCRQPGSCATYLREHLLSHFNIDPARVRLLDGTASDPEAECRAYELQIRVWGGLDLVVLGIGENGHIAFNAPGSPFDSHTRLVTLTEATRAANAYLFGGIEQTPTQGLTLGLATIMEARQVMLLASGEHKADILVRALNGLVAPAVPASILQSHPTLIVIAG
jgi:glucosamine-6-phosphate deaminase